VRLVVNRPIWGDPSALRCACRRGNRLPLADPRAWRFRHPVWARARARTNGTPGTGASRLLRIGARAIPTEALDLEHVPGSWTGSHVRGSPRECALRV